MSGGLTDTGCEKQSHGFEPWIANLPQECPLCGRPRCTSKAKTRPGERCRQHPIPGGKTCRFHGSGTEAARAAAAASQQEAAAGEIVKKAIWNTQALPVTNPVEALQQLAGRVQAAVDLLGEDLDFSALEKQPVQARAWLQLVRESRQLMTDMERNGIFSRAVEIEAARVQRMAVAYDGALGQAIAEWPELAEALSPSVRAFLTAAFVGLLRDTEPGPGPAALEGGAA